MVLLLLKYQCWFLHNNFIFNFRNRGMRNVCSNTYEQSYTYTYLPSALMLGGAKNISTFEFLPILQASVASSSKLVKAEFIGRCLRSTKNRMSTKLSYFCTHPGGMLPARTQNEIDLVSDSGFLGGQRIIPYIYKEGKKIGTSFYFCIRAFRI